MKKIIFMLILLAFATALSAQNSGENSTATVQSIILKQCAQAIDEQDYDKAVLWYVLVENLLDPDIIYQYEVVMPQTMQLHIDRKTSFERPAAEILLFLKSKKM